MIFQALDCIRRQVNNSVDDDPGTVFVELGNIGDVLNGNSLENDPPIVLSLINIEENRISRDPRNYTYAGSELLMKNPAVHLNLTLLFTALNSTPATGYGMSLQNLQRVVEFFQGQSVFDHTNTIPPGDLDPRIEKLVLEMVTLSLEQLNHLWGILGGKYQPSVVYRMRMVTIDRMVTTPGRMITEIEENYLAIQKEE